MLWNPWATKTSALISFVFVVTDQRIPSEQTMILLLKSFLTRCFNHLYISYLSNSFIFCFITTIWLCTFQLLTSVCSVPECQILLCEVMNFLSLIHFTFNVCVCMFFWIVLYSPMCWTCCSPAIPLGSYFLETQIHFYFLINGSLPQAINVYAWYVDEMI